MGHSWVSQAATAFLLLTCVYAWFKGGAAEKQGAVILLVCNIAGDIILALTFPNQPGILMLTADFILALALLGLALRYCSLWLGGAMLLQSIALCIHAFALGGEGPQPFECVVANNVISQLMLLCIIIGTTLSWQSRRRRPGSTLTGVQIG